jgi:hypothetical protein
MVSNWLIIVALYFIIVSLGLGSIIAISILTVREHQKKDDEIGGL